MSKAAKLIRKYCALASQGAPTSVANDFRKKIAAKFEQANDKKRAKLRRVMKKYIEDQKAKQAQGMPAVKPSAERPDAGYKRRNKQ